jgi:hypothetical protein
LDPANTITLVEGYAPGSNLPAASKTYTTVGTGSFSGTGARQERQVAALVKFTTDAKTKRNHPVYLFNYYHAAYMSTSVLDTVSTALSGALNTYAGQWISGFSDGAVTHNRCGPNGAVALTGATETYLTHRDFPRR